jgi:Tol biopolymer transport system component
MRIRLALAAVAVGATALPAASAATYPDLDVFTVDARGHVRSLTTNPALETSPSPSPDGTRIAFVSSQGNKPEVYVMPATGGTATRLTTSPFEDNAVAWNDAGRTSISWSPDGKRLAFDVQNATYPSTCEKNCVVWSVYIVGADGTGLHSIATEARSPAWSRDGRLLAYEDGVTPDGEATGVAVDRLNGTRVRIHAFNADSSVGPAWSPRRDELAFQAGGRVYTVRADGAGLRRLARGTTPAWSPDGGSIAFARGGALLRMSRTGTAVRRLASGWATVGYPAWSPGGRAIAFFARTRVGSGAPQIAVVPATAGRPQRLAPVPGYDAGPAWLGRTGSLVFAGCGTPPKCLA